MIPYIYIIKSPKFPHIEIPSHWEDQFPTISIVTLKKYNVYGNIDYVII